MNAFGMKLFIVSLTEDKKQMWIQYFTKASNNQISRKNDRDKRYIKNWRPISLLNVDTTVILKALSERLENVPFSLVSTQQTVYIRNRFIGKSGRLISDIVDIYMIVTI